MNEFLRTALPFSKARAFFARTLPEGHTLSRTLLEVLCFEEGEFFAITAHGVAVDKLQDFDCGGIFPLEPLETAGISVRKQKTSKVELAIFLAQELAKIKQGSCVFEEPAFEKGDECLLKAEKQISCFKEEVYYFAGSNDSSEENLSFLISLANAQWYYMNIITTAACVSRELKMEDIVKIAQQTHLVVLGAYDMEGFVFWEKTF